MVSHKRKSRESIPKTKTFVGCWTCRTRKVKCDGARPECERCRRGKHKCQGYNVKLYWITDDDHGIAPSAIKRQAMSLGESHHTWKYSLDELDIQILYIDAQESYDIADRTISSGPFAVFQSKPGYPQMTDDHSFCSDETWESLSLEDNENSPSDDSSEMEVDSLTVYSHNRSPDLSLLTVPSGLNPSIFRDSMTDILVNNYVFEVANILTPLPHPENPYASIYIPKALDGAAAVVSSLDGLLPTTISPGNIAIFYALLATSAFHIQSKSDSTNSGLRFDVLARDFRGRAMGFLRKALQDSVGEENGIAEVRRTRIAPSTDEVTLSAMLTLITMDVMEGSMSEHRIHLQGVERFASQLRKHGQISPQIKRLLTISSFLTTISNTTSLDLTPIAWTETNINDHPSPGSEVPDFEYGLEFTYGITPTLVSLMRQMVTLARNISYYTSRAASFPASLCVACVKVSDLLSQWGIDDEPLAAFFTGPDMHIRLQIAQHHILAFAHSLRVYYHTRILPCTASDMAFFVDRVASHLVEIEDIKKNAGFGTNSGTTIVWPGFIASCEASQGEARDVWYGWWRSMSKQSIGNIAHLWQMVQEAWAIRDEGSTEVPAWVSVIRRSGKQVLAV